VAETVQGIQGSGVITSVKHFIGNEQETNRNPSGKVAAVSSNIDDKTIHELYLWPFQDAVHAGAGCIMCSYNRLNNSYGCQNSKTLNGLLKTELGFEGFVVSDWAAQRKSPMETLLALLADDIQIRDCLRQKQDWMSRCRILFTGERMEGTLQHQ
jgi:beta-glucosidase